MFKRLTRNTPFVTNENPGYSGPEWTPGLANKRVPVSVQPQMAPDPPMQGLIPSRPAQVQVATFFYDTNMSQDDRFQTGDPLHEARAWVPRGRQTPDNYRQNIGRQQANAYGSMVAMTYDG